MRLFSLCVLGAALPFLSALAAGPNSSGGGGPGGSTCGGGSALSGDAYLLQAVFADPRVWQSVSGPLRKIIALPKGTFQVTTTEYVPGHGANGDTAYVPQDCTFTAEVQLNDACAPEVASLDFSACPAAKKSKP